MFLAGIRRILIILLVLLLALVAFIHANYTQSAKFPDRTDLPLLPATDLEVVTELPMPPGNIAVSDQGTVFFTFHPEARPEINVAKLEDGNFVPFPSAEWQPGGSEPLAFNEVLSLRIDQQNRLWVLDNGVHGLDKVRLIAFNPDTGELLHRYDFSRAEFALGSHANDLQITRDGRYIIMSDASLLAQTPALVVYDIQERKAWRRLQEHESVLAGEFEPVVQGREMTIFGLFTVNPGVDGLTLDADDSWLYYASISADQLYRIPVEVLTDPDLSEVDVKAAVEAIGEKTMTDGMAADAEGNIYLSDLEHSAIVRFTPEGQLETLVKSAMIRWPDGFSWGPDGYLYFTCSSLHEVIGRDPMSVQSAAPFQIYRFLPPRNDSDI